MGIALAFRGGYRGFAGLVRQGDGVGYIYRQSSGRHRNSFRDRYRGFVGIMGLDNGCRH